MGTSILFCTKMYSLFILSVVLAGCVNNSKKTDISNSQRSSYSAEPDQPGTLSISEQESLAEVSSLMAQLLFSPASQLDYSFGEKKQKQPEFNPHKSPLPRAIQAASRYVWGKVKQKENGAQSQDPICLTPAESQSIKQFFDQIQLEKSSRAEIASYYDNPDTIDLLSKQLSQIPHFGDPATIESTPTAPCIATFPSLPQSATPSILEKCAHPDIAISAIIVAHLVVRAWSHIQTAAIQSGWYEKFLKTPNP